MNPYGRLERVTRRVSRRLGRCILQIEGTFRAHQVPMLVDPEHIEHVPLLESWMRSYKAEELFDQTGRLIP
jgi:phosphoketolase